MLTNELTLWQNVSTEGNMGRHTVVIVADIVNDYNDKCEYDVEGRIIHNGKVVYSHKQKGLSVVC